jgi:hypothetical protein
MLQQPCANVFSHVNMNKRLHPIPARGNSSGKSTARRNLTCDARLLAAQQILHIVHFIH